MSRAVAILLIHKIYEQNYTTSQLEEYFGKKWNILQRELKAYLKEQPSEEIKYGEIVHQLEKNDERDTDFER